LEDRKTNVKSSSTAIVLKKSFANLVRISLVDAEIPVIVLIGSLKIKIINIETKAGKKNH